MLDTRLPDASFDLVAVQFVTHECPSWVIESLVRAGLDAGQVCLCLKERSCTSSSMIRQRCARRCPCLQGHTYGRLPCWAHPSPQVKECRRLLRPGGVLAIADNNPRSKVGCKEA